MLNWLKIKNLALVADVEIEFGERFNVITGETGAGKSVIMGSIGLLLGERADKSAIRSGESRCEVSAAVDTGKVIDRIQPILEEAGLDVPADTEPLYLRRIITPTSTRNFVNDTPVTLQTLKEIGDCLIDIHGANEHQSLFRQSIQLELLDRYGKLDGELATCRGICDELRQTQLKKEELLANLPSPVEAEHLRLIVNEIERVSPNPGEDEELSSKHARAANSRQIVELSSAAIQQLTESDSSLSSQLGQVYRELQILARTDEENCETFLAQCDQLSELINGLSSDLESYASGVELDEQEFEELENRLSALETLKRRYGPGLENVFLSLEESQARLQSFEHSEQLRADLEAEEAGLREALRKTAEKLSKARQKAAADFSKKVTKELQLLGFLKSEFDVAFKSVEAGPNGADQIDFLFCPNPGEAPQPLRKIGSSGEISRVMLALKTVLAEADSVPILIFDEIDVNIGGETATRVASELSKLANSHQLLCISHLPTVAAKADHHFEVRKTVSKGRTTTSIVELDSAEQLGEITRMLGGSKAATEHAKELLGQ